jgi:hypothetical protein
MYIRDFLWVGEAENIWEISEIFRMSLEPIASDRALI